MAPPHPALLERLWESPEDRSLLRVYADWLHEQGESTRGEYMQLSLLDARTPAQEKRRATLLRQHRGKWLGAARPYLYTWVESEVSPGFIASVQCSTQKLAAGLELIRALGPRLVVNVNPVTTSRERARLASLPLGRLHGLGFTEGDADWVSGALMTAVAPALAGLRSLQLFISDDRFTLAGWRAVLDSVTTLRSLEFDCLEAPDVWLAALLESPAVGWLQSVTLLNPGDPALRTRLEKAFEGRTLRFTP